MRPALVQFRTSSMPAMLAITKHGVCVGAIAPCLVNFIIADMEVVQNCTSTAEPWWNVTYCMRSGLDMFCFCLLSLSWTLLCFISTCCFLDYSRRSRKKFPLVVALGGVIKHAFSIFHPLIEGRHFSLSRLYPFQLGASILYFNMQKY